MARRKVDYDGREQCDACGEYHHQKDMSFAEDGTQFCATCTKQMEQVCKGCGKTLPVWEMTGYDAEDHYYCEDCAISI